MIRYAFKDGPITIKNAKIADPQKLGEELDLIAAGSESGVTPAKVVDVARSEDSVLHPHFEWDDAVAAEKHRLEEARNLMRSIHPINVETGEVSGVPRWVSIKGAEGTSYRTMDEVRKSPDLQARLLAAADRDLEAFQTRYRTLKDVCAEVGRAREVIRKKREATETRVAA